MGDKVRKHTFRHAPNKDSNQPVCPHSLLSLCCLHEESLHPWLSKMKILVRLHKRTD